MIPPFGRFCERPEGLRVLSAHLCLDRGERRAVVFPNTWVTPGVWHPDPKAPSLRELSPLGD